MTRPTRNRTEQALHKTGKRAAGSALTEQELPAVLADALPAGVVQLGGRCGLELGEGVGGGVEGGLPDRLAEGPVADDGGVDALAEQGGDDPADYLQPVGGHQIPLHDPMPSHPQLRPDGELVLDQVSGCDLRRGAVRALVGEMGGEGGLDLPAVQPEVGAGDLQPSVGLAGDVTPADGVAAWYLNDWQVVPPPHNEFAGGRDGQEERSMMAASEALRLMEAIPLRTPALVL